MPNKIASKQKVQFDNLKFPQNYSKVLMSLINRPNKSSLKSYDKFAQKKFNIEQEIARRENLKNQALGQDIKLKKDTLSNLFRFLAIETIAVFGFAFFQAIHFLGFALEEWSFRLIMTVTILQITYMLRVAVRHLFPTNQK